jgi:hypothetical protein
VNFDDERQTPATNGTSDERGELEREASSGRKEWERALLLFIERRRGEEASARGVTRGASDAFKYRQWRRLPEEIMGEEKKRSHKVSLIRRRRTVAAAGAWTSASGRGIGCRTWRGRRSLGFGFLAQRRVGARLQGARGRSGLGSLVALARASCLVRAR